MINPFRHKIVTNPWDDDVTDVPEINPRPFNVCMEAFGEVRETHRSTSVLLHGEAGSGKTHMLRKLRAQLNREKAKHVFISVRLQSGPNRFWRYLRKSFVESLVQKNLAGKEQLNFVLSRRFINFLLAHNWTSPPRDIDNFSQAFKEFCIEENISRNLHKVLFNYCFITRRKDAVAWLRGDLLPEGVLKKLGLPAQNSEKEDPEEEAREMVLSMCRLGGSTFPFIICFDQIEAMQREPGDKTALFVFGKAVRYLHDSTKNLLIVSCVQSFFESYLRETMMESDYAALAIWQGSLRPLSRKEATKLVSARLELRPDFSKRENGIPGDLANKLEAFLTAGKGRQTARAVLSYCANWLDELETGEGPATVPGARGPKNHAKLTESFLNTNLNKRVEKTIDHISPEKMDEILQGALPILMNLLNPDWKEQDRITAGAVGKKLKDVDILLEGKNKRVGISLCNEKNMTSLASRFRRLMDQLQEGELDNLLLIRHPELTISEGARQARTYLKRLIRDRGRLIQPSTEVIAVLGAMGRLLADAKAGDLDNDGEIVDAGTVEEWIKTHLAGDSRDFLEDISSDIKKADENDFELIQNMMVMLDGAKIAKLSDIAEKLESGAEELETIVRRHTGQIGYLEGPPPVIFQKVSGGLIVHDS